LYSCGNISTENPDEEYQNRNTCISKSLHYTEFDLHNYKRKLSIFYDSSYPSGLNVTTTGCMKSFQMMLASVHTFWSMLWVTTNTAFLMRACYCWRSWFLTLWTRFFAYLHRKKSNVINMVTLVARQLPLLCWSTRQASCDISQFIPRLPGRKTIFSRWKPP